MGKYTNKFLPQIRRIIELASNKVGYLFNTKDDLAEVYLQGDKLSFKVNDTVVMSLTETSLVDETGTIFLPDQLGQAGKYLTTNGLVTRWETVSGSGGALDHSQLTSIGNNTHDQIDTGLEAASDHRASSNNPHNTNKTHVGLSNVPNTDCTNAYNITSGTLASSRLSTSGVSVGSYTSANITVDAYGRVVAASNGSGGGSSADSRRGIVSLSLGTQAVTFSEPLGSSNYVTSLVLYNASGNNVIHTNYSGKTAEGFNITVPVACTLEYRSELVS